MIEFLLLTALGLALWRIVVLNRRLSIVRHLFIQSSDWNGTKIAELRDATIGIAANVGSLSLEDAEGEVWHSVLEAPEHWGEQVDQFQRKLKLNGMEPLGYGDLDNLNLSAPRWFKR